MEIMYGALMLCLTHAALGAAEAAAGTTERTHSVAAVNFISYP
jgi:hypothetical protein